jgi:hypothetical protein
MSFLKFAVKSAFWSTIIIGGGYALMVAVVPPEDKLRDQINKYREMRGQEPVRVDKEVYRKQMEAILENARSDRPIWDVKL